MSSLVETKNLGDILRLPARGERPAYTDLRDPHHPRTLTALELDQLICAVARGLRARGVTAGCRVGIVSENRLEFVASYFGIMRLGAVAVPVNYKLPPATIAHIFRDSGIVIAFSDAVRRAMVPEGVPIVGFDDKGSGGFEALLDPGPIATFLPGTQDLAEILYTSGSTGLPKGVPLTHHGQCWAIAQYHAPLDAAPPADTTLVVAPLYHMNGLFFTTVALSNRMNVISLPRFEARRYLETVADHRCTVLSGIPTMFALMVRERELPARLDFAAVCEVTISSAPLTGALLRKVQDLFPNATLKNAFGTTEAGPAVFGPHPEARARPPLSLGYPLPGVEWRLADGPSPDEGVLQLRTPALMSGYLNLPAVSAQKLREGWYVTGDVLRRDAEGFFYFVGRGDDMFVCGGENIYPGEVESLLERHARIAQAIVVAAPDDIKGQIPVAFIVPQPGTSLDVEEVKQFALANGAAYAHPRLVVFRSELPVAGTHKIDRTSLTAEAARLAILAGRSASVE